MSVDHQRLNLTYRKGCPGLFPQHLCDVDDSQRGIVGEIQGLLIPCLAVEQSGELVAVAEAELNLKSCAIDIIDILAGHIGVSREVKAMTSVGQIMDYKANFLLEQLAPYYEFVGHSLVRIYVKTFHHGLVGIGKVNLSVLGLGSTPFAGTLSFVDVIQHGIGTQTAYQREACLFETFNERQIGEGGVCYKQRCDFGQLGTVFLQYRQIPLVEIYLHGIKFGCVLSLHGT